MRTHRKRLLWEAKLTESAPKRTSNFDVGFRGLSERSGAPFRMSHRRAEEKYMDPDTWLANTYPQEGSWWPAWAAWLEEHSSGEAPPPPMGASDKEYAPLCDAPGTYVFQR